MKDPDIFNLLKTYLSGLLSYKGMEYREINDYIENIEDRGESMLAESLDILIEKGREEGRGEVLKEKEAIVLKMLKEDFDIKMIHHLTEMPMEQINELKKRL